MYRLDFDVSLILKQSIDRGLQQKGGVIWVLLSHSRDMARSPASCR